MHDCCTGNKYWAVATRGKLRRYDLCTSKNKQRKKQVKRVAITGFQNYQIAEQLLFYRCTLNSNHITLSLGFLAKLFTDDIDIGKYWMSFLNPMEEHVLIGELSGGV